MTYDGSMSTEIDEALDAVLRDFAVPTEEELAELEAEELGFPDFWFLEDLEFEDRERFL